MTPNVAPTTLCSCLPLVVFWLFGHGVCVEVTVPPDPVMQQRGLNVELPCHYKTSILKDFMLEWRFAPGSTAPENGKQILYYTNDQLYKNGPQADRLSLLYDPPTLGSASIQLSKVRASDAGTYTCQVNNPPDFSGSGFGLIHFTVLMPPSTPACKAPTSASVGSDARLSCISVEGVPAPTYTWTRVDPKTPLPLSNMVQDGKSGNLLLTNLSLHFSGTYGCVASNEFGQQSCQVTLSVSSISNAGATAGAVIAVILALLLLSAVVIYLLRCRKKKPTATQSVYSGNDIREDATAPGIPEESLHLRRDSEPESHLLEKLSSRPGSASTTKSNLNKIVA